MSNLNIFDIFYIKVLNKLMDILNYGGTLFFRIFYHYFICSLNYFLKTY